MSGMPPSSIDPEQRIRPHDEGVTTSGRGPTGDLPPRSSPPLLLAHRGDWSEAPENSLGAFVAAAGRRGVDGVEFDVRAAVDGTPVVIHDEDLLRMQGVDRRVDELTPLELRALGVPDLGAVLDALPEPRFVDVELKEDVGAQVVTLLAEARGDPPRRTVVSSFLPEVIVAVLRLAPGWPCWLISEQLDERVYQVAREAGCQGIAAEWPALDQRSVGLVRDAGLELATWTVSDAITLEWVVRLGPVAVCVDPPALPSKAL
jgi:glycerophosphoryl diester phosphodiesterase